MTRRYRTFILSVLLAVMLTAGGAVLSARPAAQYNFRHLDTSDGLSANNVKSIVRDNLGFMWFGTKNGLNRYDGSAMRVFECYDEELGCGNNNVGALYEDENSMLWIGTDRGIYRYNPHTDRISFVDLTPDDGARPDNWVQTIDGDSRGNVWALLPDEGVYRYSDGKVWHFAFSQGSAFKKVFPADICVSDDGNVWVVMSGDGLYRYEPSADSFVKVREPVGLSRYDKDRDAFVTYGIAEGLPDDVVYSVVEDRGKNLWFGTNRGLVRFTPSTGVIRVFTRDDGLSFDQFNYKSAVMTPDGTVYMGGVNGVISFRPEDYKELTTPLPIYFTGLSVLNQDVRPGEDSSLKDNILFTKHLKLNHDESTFTLSIASPEFMHLGKARFSYRLLPVSDEWIDMKDNEISFTNLATGKYTLEIKVESESTSASGSLRIEVLPPWWKSGWAYFAYILLIGFAVTAWFLWYRNRKEMQLRAHEQSMMDIKDKELYRSKVNFFTEIAHEIRTPLSLIDLPLEAMEELKIEDPQFKNYLSVTRKNTRRLLDLTGQLLDFEKIDSSRLTLKRENVDITALLNDTADRFETPMRLDGKTLVRDIDPHPLTVVTDREAIIKIVSNLLNNARKYGKSTVRLSLSRSGQDFMIKVASDGEKIRPEDRESIFRAFYQTDVAAEMKNGVGIGLPLSRSLATLLGGNLMLEDNPSEDFNVFTVTVPVVEPVAAEPATDPEIDAYMIAAESNQAKPRPDVFSILLVEDNETILKFLAEQLSHSFVVNTARNGVEALEKLRQNQPDLILTDIMMPEMDGLELCNTVKSDMNLNHIPLVFITAKNDLESKIQGLQYGAEAYVEKPFSIKYLRNLITSILDNRRREREAFVKNPFYTSENAQVGEADREFMEKVRTLIEEHISDENFSVDMLCDGLNMSRSVLLRKIKSLFGLSPIEVIRTIKLKRAAELIQDGRYRIGDVCYMVGIATPSYFSKLFFKQFGMTPKDFEKQCRSRNTADDGAQS